jgi:hypothetical protein
LVIDLSSIVLNIEHIVALLNVSSRSFTEAEVIYVRNTKQENDTNAQLSSTV